MSETQEIADAINKRGAGKTAGLMACILAICGILFLGTVFIPIAVIVALIGTIIAIKNKNYSGIGICFLAWVLIVIGFATSPLLLSIIGIAVL